MLFLGCDTRQVKEAVVLADKLKTGPFDPIEFKKELAKAKRALRSLSEISIEEAYFKDHRDRLSGVSTKAAGRWAS